MNHFHAASPILRVRNLDAAIAWYARVLEFTVDWTHEARIASISRAHCNLMLSEEDQGAFGTWVWVGVSDAVALHAAVVAAGGDVPLPPSNFPWAMEFHLRDPDGNVLRLGSGPRTDRPWDAWRPWYAAEARSAD